MFNQSPKTDLEQRVNDVQAEIAKLQQPITSMSEAANLLNGAIATNSLSERMALYQVISSALESQDIANKILLTMRAKLIDELM